MFVGKKNRKILKCNKTQWIQKIGRKIFYLTIKKKKQKKKQCPILVQIKINYCWKKENDCVKCAGKKPKH